ncbi:bifunctional metallophosphatase/5'-nucleotidase [Halorubrum sp. BOL3-1]|uniref:bifunctional metallophosphatase/5'-nucleotidase n=1 Tax=Halorubrum sp. BOL3-1 TaxID=2497325 RepID=UPI001004F5E2|nr:5'-nucleotidase C-terminal domain-containing protein [Halorubrum sp. BOL3-1]QAU11789.1 bifunctional metallophosphatase/5'-nucleotidase [Halorubrum sp. BOL3-1]
MSKDTRSGEVVDETRRRLLAAAAGGVTVGALGTGATGGAAAEDDGTLTLVHDTHLHGRFEDAGNEAIDVARYYAVVEEFRGEYPNAAFLGNGDDLAPSVLGLEFEGEHMVEALNEMGPDAVGAGNHEFDFGVDTASERFESSEFPWVIANLLTPEGEPVPGAERWTTVEVGGHTVGVFGMGTTGFYDITDYPDDWRVLGYAEAAEAAVEALESETDFIVCASHVSSGVHETIAAVDGVDAIVGSHSGVVYEEPETIEGTTVAEFGDEFDHIGRLTFDVETGELSDWERVDLYDSEALDEDESPPESTENFTPRDVRSVDRNQPVAEIADGYLSDLEERLGQPVVESEVELNASFDNYEVETGWGNLMTDLMRGVGNLDEEIDVAVQNSGGIRSGSRYGPGELTGSDVMNILPFPNEIVVYELTGEQVRSYLERSVRPMPGDYGAQPAIQVSGVSYEWTGHDGEGQVRNVWIGGEPLDPEETYLVSTNDFVAGRSDEFVEESRVFNSGQFQGPFVKDTLDAEYDTIAPEREERMIRVDEVIEDPTVEGSEGTLTVSFGPTDAVASVVEDTYRLVAPGHGTVAASSVSAGDEVVVELAADAVVEGFDATEADALSLVGGFDPNSEHYGYETEDGEVIELPVNASYDYYELRTSLSADDVRATVGGDDGSDGDDSTDGDDSSDGDDGGDGDDGSYGSDGSDGDDGSDSGGDGGETADDTPGFGPLAGAAGVSGAAYLYEKYGASDGSDERTADE